MSVSALEILSAIENEGNFRKAAASLGVTNAEDLLSIGIISPSD